MTSSIAEIYQGLHINDVFPFRRDFRNVWNSKVKFLESIKSLDLCYADLPAYLPTFIQTAKYFGQDTRLISERFHEFLKCSVSEITQFSPQKVSSRLRSRTIPRMGVVSANLHIHSVARIFTDLLNEISESKVHITFFIIPSRTSSLLEKITQLAYEPHVSKILGLSQPGKNRLVNLPASLSESIRVIQDSCPDILFYPDLGSLTQSYCLASMRLAPCQITSWGEATTSGIKTVDYYVSSKYFETTNSAQHYTEKLITLDNIPAYVKPMEFEQAFAQGYAFEQLAIEITSTVYTCLQNPCKYDHKLFSAIELILAQDSSATFLISSGKDSVLSIDVLKHWRPFSQQTTLDRVRLVPWQDTNSLMSILWDSDVILDTIDFSGGISSYNSIQIGTPVVTLAGHFLRSNITSAIHNQSAQSKYIARTLEEYVSMAVAIGNIRKRTRSTRRPPATSANEQIFRDSSAVIQFTELVQRLANNSNHIEN